MPRHLLPLATALAVATTTTVLAMPAVTSAAPSAPAAGPKGKETPFAMTATAFGTRIVGGMVPAGSSTTAFNSIACNNQVGKHNTNVITDVEIPGLGTVSGAATNVRTVRMKGKIMSIARHDVASVQILDSPLGSLSVEGLSSVSKAWHDAEGYHASTNTKLASIVFTPPGGGDPQSFPIPTPDQPIEIPGLATISIGNHIVRETPKRGYARGAVLTIEVEATGTTVDLARSTAKIVRGNPAGVFQGYASPARAQVLGSLIQVGRVINQIMPCEGTDGKVQEKSAAGVNLADQLVVDGAYTRQKANGKGKRAHGFEESGVASVDLGDGTLVIDAIKGRANAERNGKKVAKNADGTNIGAITFQGEPMSLEELDGLEIPGLARIDTNLVERYRRGLKVIAVQITLLDGQEVDSVVNLGEAKFLIRPTS